jgi:hypothetical protein
MALPTDRQHAAFDPVVLLCRAAILLCGLVLLHLPARAAILIHEYALRGSLEDTFGGNPLTALGGQITDLGYVFAANQGLAFSSRLFTPKDYTIELSFRFDTTIAASKIIDFHHLTAESGLYQRNGTLAFRPAGTTRFSDFVPGTNVHVVLTRDGATDLVTAYVNGQQRFSFCDDLSLAAPPGLSNKLSFFVGDKFNASGGTADYLRIFNGALTASEVSALFAAVPPMVVPEPSTLILLTTGTLALALTWRRRRNRR